MWIMADTNYKDIQQNRQVSIGEVYKVSAERGAQIIRAGYAHEVLVMTPAEHQAAIDAQVMLAVQARMDAISGDTVKAEESTVEEVKPKRGRKKAE